MQELIDVEGDGMADMVFRCIQEMDIDNRMMVWLDLPYAFKRHLSFGSSLMGFYQYIKWINITQVLPVFLGACLGISLALKPLPAQPLCPLALGGVNLERCGLCLLTLIGFFETMWTYLFVFVLDGQIKYYLDHN